MTAAEQPGFAGRFPGFDVLDQSRHWDDVTAAAVWSRIGPAPDIRYFTPAEQAVATALCDQLLDLNRGVREADRVPVVNMIDARLSEQQTDGWHYADMAEDGQAWRESLAALDEDAHARFGAGFAHCSAEQQAELVGAVQGLKAEPWHGLVAARVWSLWTRYACTAFYSHPSAWNEIGFSGPAYPRGYKNTGVDAREPFEVRDAKPAQDPLRRQR